MSPNLYLIVKNCIFVLSVSKMESILSYLCQEWILFCPICLKNGFYFVLSVSGMDSILSYDVKNGFYFVLSVSRMDYILSYLCQEWILFCPICVKNGFYFVLSVSRMDNRINQKVLGLENHSDVILEF